MRTVPSWCATRAARCTASTRETSPCAAASRLPGVHQLPVARLLAILPGVNASHLLGLLAHRARPLLGLALALVLAAPAAGCAAVWETPTPTPEPTVTPAGTREPYTVATFAPPTPTSDVPLPAGCPACWAMTAT